MSMDIYSLAPPVAKKRRTYSKEFKLSIVNSCKHPNTSVTLKHDLNPNLALLHKDLKCKAPLIEPNLRRNLGKWST